MSDTLMRQWLMLNMIPRHPKKIAVSQIRMDLEQEGFRTSMRTIQRDLNRLSEQFPLVSDERSKPFGWSWAKDAKILDIPGMDSHTALAFWTADQHLKPLLPKSTVGKLQMHFNRAAKVLDSTSAASPVSRWRDKLRVLHRGPPLRPPAISEKVQDTVYDALLRGLRLEVTYLARGDKSEKSYEVSPHGLVIKEGLSYLVCSLWDYSDVKLLLLHRMRSVSLLDKPSTAPLGFDLDNLIASVELDYAVGGKIRLRARFSDNAAHHLAERPLSEDQSLKDLGDGKAELAATVNDTAELRWWLLAFGAQVEVLEPDDLRRYMMDSIARMADVYNCQAR